MLSTGYHPQDIPPSPQNTCGKSRRYPVGDILWKIFFILQVMLSTGYNPQDIPPSPQNSREKTRLYPVCDILQITFNILQITLWRITVHRIYNTLYRISPTGHTTLSSEIVLEISCDRYPVYHIVYPVENYSPQDIHYTLQDITHRTYLPISCV